MGQLFFHEESKKWNFKTLACTVHKIWHASGFIQIVSKGHNSRKGDNSDKKKKNVSAIFPWGIHIWNFKTLACMVFDKRMHGQPETNMLPQPLRSWGHNKLYPFKKFAFSEFTYIFFFSYSLQIKSEVYKLFILQQTALLWQRYWFPSRTVKTIVPTKLNHTWNNYFWQVMLF